MRALTILAAGLILASGVRAEDLGAKGPVAAPGSCPETIPGSVLQGGDTITSATVIPCGSYLDYGNTAAYNDDYDEVCPYDGGTAPDVVYRFTAVVTFPLTIDLCGSGYDTKLYIYDSDLNLIACNDDFYFGEPCGNYVSRLDNVTVHGGTTYYIIVDGYGSASGSYVLSIMGMECRCPVECPDDGLPEGEPPLVDDYVDSWNGGCNTEPGYPFGVVGGDADGTATLCGVSGWYQFQNSDYRDTDWYILTMGPTGDIGVELQAEYATYIFELGPQDCANVGIIQQATDGDCGPSANLTITGYTAGAPVWLWIGPTVFAPPAGSWNEYDYVAWFSGLEPNVATETTTWSTVKALYD